MVTSLLSDQEVSCSIPGSIAGVYSSEGLFHRISELNVPVFKYVRPAVPCSRLLLSFDEILLHSADHRSGMVLSLCPRSRMRSIESS